MSPFLATRASDSLSEEPDDEMESTSGRAPSRDQESTPRTNEQRLELTVRVYTYPRDGRWYAEALNLALMAEGATEAEAITCLVEQVVAYVRTAVMRGWLDQLRRPASLRHRMAVQARVALAKLKRQPAVVTNRLVRI